MEKSAKKNLSPCIRSLLLPSKKQCKHENHHIHSVFQCWLERSFQDVWLLWHWPHWIPELQVKWKLSSIHLCLLCRLHQRVDDGSPSGGTVERGGEVGTSLQQYRQRWQWKPLLQRDQENDLCSEDSGLFSNCFWLFHGKIQVIFEKFDKNNDGIVTKEEFVSVLKEDKDIVKVLQRSYN